MRFKSPETSPRGGDLPPLDFDFGEAVKRAVAALIVTWLLAGTGDADASQAERLGDYGVTAGNGPEPGSALRSKAADGIRTHDLLHGKQTL
jgi:hypothetical protein